MVLLRGFMTRSTVLLSALLVSACSVGEVDLNRLGPDGAGGGDAIGASPRDICADRPATIGIQHNHTADGANPAGPRAGVGCQTGTGCHGAAPGAGGAFAFSGSVYKEAAGTTPNPGVVVRVFKEDPAGTFTLVASAPTDDAGNFYMIGNYADFPYITDATACGSDQLVQGIRPMVGIIATGDCNGGAACHQTPGTFPMYLLD